VKQLGDSSEWISYLDQPPCLIIMWAWWADVGVFIQTGEIKNKRKKGTFFAHVTCCDDTYTLDQPP